MGNSRQLRAGRRAKQQTRKDLLTAAYARISYLEGLVMSLEAQLAATKMERPADLDDWIESIVPDMSDEERDEWEAMSPEAQDRFKDELGVKINTAMKLNAVGLDADALPSPSASGQGS